MNAFLRFVSICFWTVLIESASLHPNLYFSPDDLADLRHKARTTHVHVFNRLREAAEEIKQQPNKHLPPVNWDEFAGQWNERYGNDLGALAMYCVLEETDIEVRQLAIYAMDILSALPNWRVKASMRDDVPVAHSLVAMATAYDFLYGYLDARRRLVYLEKIKSVTKEMYDRSFKLSWGNTYIQNHVATNYVALFSGALVVEKHHNEASVWKKRAHVMLNRTMFLLSHVVDGSLEEGVAYGSYTSRSLTQYVFLAERHLGLDLTDNAWLKQHFWFYYRTILPGFRETVGIADSNLNWFYGPESQLVFLDRFVMRNGHGNWLASRIRELRSKLEELRGSPSHRYCTLHTEFLFYDSTIPEKAPPHPGIPHMHVFSDWGVVTYGGGLMTSDAVAQVERHPKAGSNTFLSFKCGVLHGRAVNQIARSPHSWLSGWRNFNPGHEHPDQGSFVFAPNGVPFITEALYGPKYTWLNNVLLFGPSLEPGCSAPYEGQIGDCNKWMDFKNPQSWLARGEIITASESNGMVFLSGEMSKWYSSSLGLASVYRAVILLSPGVLLVVDHVEKTANSKTEYFSAFFHNRNAPFEVRNRSRAEIVLERQTYTVSWNNSNYQETEARSQSAEYAAEYGKRKTHYLNITTNLLNAHTRTAYVFSSPGHEVSRPRLEAENRDVIKIHLKIDGVDHCVSIVTRHSSPFARYHFLGFGGFAMVRVGNNPTIRFGLENSVEQFEEPRDFINHVRRPNPVYDFRLLLPLAILPFCFLIAMYFNVLTYQCRRRIRCHWFIVVLLGIILCWISLFSSYLFNNCSSKSIACSNKTQKDEREILHARHSRRTQESSVPPIVLHTIFPFAEPGILQELFRNNTDFVQMNVKSNPGKEPCSASATTGDQEKRMCDFINSSLDIGWLKHVLSNADILTLWKAKQRLSAEGTFAKIRSVPIIDNLVTLLLEEFEKMFWMPLAEVSRLRSVVAVRDPRRWIGSWFSKTPGALRYTRLRHQILSLLSYKEIEAFVSSSTEVIDLSKMLAYLWKIQVKRYVAFSNRIPLLLIQLEELSTNPTEAGARVYRFLGLPYPPFVEHRLLQYTHTGPHPGEAFSDEWQSVLSREQVKAIENMCQNEMKLMGYQLHSD